MTTDIKEFTERARRSLQRAAAYAEAQDSPHITCLHLAVAVLDDTEGVAAKAAAKCNSKYRVHLPEMPTTPDHPRDPAQSTQRFTQKCQTAVDHAISAADSLNHTYVGTEHIIMGILSIEDSSAATMLNAAGINNAAFSQAVQRILNPHVPNDALIRPTSKIAQAKDLATQALQTLNDPRLPYPDRNRQAAEILERVLDL